MLKINQKNMKVKKLYFVILITIVFFSSCREDIIPPNNPSSNINEPVRLASNNSYTFILNANSISTTVKDFSGLNGQHSTLTISLDNYVGGNVKLIIYDYSTQIIYQKFMSDNIAQYYVNLDNVTPYLLQIIFIDFTGNLKIELNNR